MAWSLIPTRTTADTVAAADINQSQANETAIKGGTAGSAPTKTLEETITAQANMVTAASAFVTDEILLGAGADKTAKTSGSTLAILSPSGMIAPFASSTAPTGWLKCEGQAISRTTYANLFAAISTTWGAGDGSTTFNVPDFRGMFIRGTGTHGSLTMADGNAFAGPAVGASETDQFQGHYHSTTNNLLGGGAGFAYDNAGVGAFSFPNTVTDPITGANGAVRSGDETRPVAYGILWIIKT